MNSPDIPGDYPTPVTPGAPPMLRHWDGASWSAPFYGDDPAPVAARARQTPAMEEPAEIAEALAAYHEFAR